MTSEGTAQLRRAVLTDLRSHQPLLDALYDPGGGPDDPRKQINTSWTRPQDPPPASLIVEAYTQGGTGTDHTTFNVGHTIEAGLTVTHGWRERKNPSISGPLGSNPGIAVDEIFDAISERAVKSFGIPALRFDGRFGGGSSTPPGEGEGGEMNRVAQWSYRRDRPIDVPQHRY